MTRIVIEMVYTGDRFEGNTPTEVVRAMKESALFEGEIADDKYKDRVAQRTKMIYGEALDTASARRFLESLRQAELIRYIEEV
ncbi:hypothetical protein M1N21_00325 [Dehalococcoidia bacterium]|nr:hypothetical protein [Dehalococcoidia bacterium]